MQERKKVVVRKWSWKEIQEVQKNAQKRFRSLIEPSSPVVQQEQKSSTSSYQPSDTDEDSEYDYGSDDDFVCDSSFEFKTIGIVGKPTANHLAPTPIPDPEIPNNKQDAFPEDGQDALVTELINVLVETCEIIANQKKEEDQDTPTIFRCRAEPPISLKDYLHRLRQYLHADVACFIYMTMNAEIYMLRNPRFHLNALTWHRLMLTSLCLAMKFHSERYYNNAYVARVGGISKKELNQLELTLFFDIVDHEIYCDRQWYQTFHQKLLPKYQFENLKLFKPAPSNPAVSSTSSRLEAAEPPKPVSPSHLGQAAGSRAP